jgi:hypothetical protein
MIVRIVRVLATLEQGAELHRLVGLVVMHRPHVQTDQSERETGRQGDRDDRRRAYAAHFGEP